MACPVFCCFLLSFTTVTHLLSKIGLGLLCHGTNVAVKGQLRLHFTYRRPLLNRLLRTTGWTCREMAFEVESRIWIRVEVYLCKSASAQRAARRLWNG